MSNFKRVLFTLISALYIGNVKKCAVPRPTHPTPPPLPTALGPMGAFHLVRTQFYMLSGPPPPFLHVIRNGNV